MATCDARLRPFPNDTEIRCEKSGESEHYEHSGMLSDYAYPGSKTWISWFEDDRRCFRGEWPGPCDTEGCVLPSGHRGNHAM